MLSGRMALGDLAKDVRSLFSDETRDWVAKNGTEIKQVGHLVFVMMPHYVAPTPPVIDRGEKATRVAENSAAVMDILADMQGHCIDDVAFKMGASITTARRTLAPLVKAGIVQRRAAEGEPPLRYAYFRV